MFTYTVDANIPVILPERTSGQNRDHEVKSNLLGGGPTSPNSARSGSAVRLVAIDTSGACASPTSPYTWNEKRWRRPLRLALHPGGMINCESTIPPGHTQIPLYQALTRATIAYSLQQDYLYFGMNRSEIACVYYR
jgi:hypothetical protein